MVGMKPNTGDLLIIEENLKSRHKNFAPDCLVDIWMENLEATGKRQKELVEDSCYSPAGNN